MHHGSDCHETAWGMRRNASKLTYVPRARYEACDQLQGESLLH